MPSWSAAAADRIRRFRSKKLSQHFAELRAPLRHTLAAGVVLAAVMLLLGATITAITLQGIYFNRKGLPDIEGFIRFDGPTIGRIFDDQGQPLAEFSKEHRRMTPYSEIPAVVRDAILAAEDKNFFSHGGVDYTRIPRVLEKTRIKTVLTRATRVGRADKEESLVMLRQGGSTITQQLVRAYYLRDLTDEENSNELRSGVLSYVIGARSAKKLSRKLEEIRLSVWLEEQMTIRYHSKQRAKEEILARYASYLYMGNSVYGFAAAAEYYFGRTLASFTEADVDKAALLAGVAKSPRYYAPDSVDLKRVLHRRNQILGLMAARGTISKAAAAAARQRPIGTVAPQNTEDAVLLNSAPAVIGSVLDELKVRYSGLGAEDLLQGSIQVYSTANARVQGIANEALEHGLALYEKRHPKSAGMVQGSVVVLKNSDAGILAEIGGRRTYQKHANNYGDLNRASKSMRQPGSAMKPIVYLAAFLQGSYTLASVVPDEPISVPDGGLTGGKAISNYDGIFKGPIPLRQALAESRNAVAIWITEQVGIDAILRTARQVGIESRLQRYETTSLGASEVTLLELANAYRTIASGTFRWPHSIKQVARGTEMVQAAGESRTTPREVDAGALALLQEGLRGVVRLPDGTAHMLDGAGFPVPVMGKTGTTNQFRDALFVGSTYGKEGITVAVRIGFDDNRSLGDKETGARTALPVFREILLRTYAKGLAGGVPAFPETMEASITQYLHAVAVQPDVANSGTR